MIKTNSLSFHTSINQLLADHVIQACFPELDSPNDNKYDELLLQVARRHSCPHKHTADFTQVTRNTARLIAQWMSVGFVHGVCNTDNFSIHAITIDYGPFGFMSDFNPNWCVLCCY